MKELIENIVEDLQEAYELSLEESPKVNFWEVVRQKLQGVYHEGYNKGIEDCVEICDKKTFLNLKTLDGTPKVVFVPDFEKWQELKRDLQQLLKPKEVK